MILIDYRNFQQDINKPLTNNSVILNLKLKHTYMSYINYSDSFKEFLLKSDSKVAQVLHQMRFKSYDPLMITNKEVDYITFRRDGTISYLPAGREHSENDNGDWAREGRQNGKPSKVIKKLFHPRVHKYIKDTDFETFTNMYKAAFTDEGFEFSIKDSSEIANVYCMGRGEGDASLNGSCMNGDEDYLEIYTNCHSLRIVTLEKDDLLYGRALLWNLKFNNEDIVLMDRVYVVQDYMYDMFLDYCNKNGWWRKQYYKTYDCKQDFVKPDGVLIRQTFKVYTDTDCSRYPYIDTFQHGDDGYITNEETGRHYYNNTDGERGGEGTYDEINDCYIDEDDSVYIECGDREYRGRTTHVDNCVEVNGDWYHVDDSNIVQVNCTWYTKDSDEIAYLESQGEWYMADEVCYCELSDSYELEDDCVYSEHHGTNILKDDAVELFGKYYHKNDVKEC